MSSSFGDDHAIEFLTGAGAAVVDCCLFHSIDTLKVRAQDGRPLLPWAQLARSPAAARPALGLRSLYQGFSTNLFLKVPYMACMFGFHSINRGLLGLLPEGTMSSGTRDCLSALFVGVEASLLLAPLELVRIQGQNRAKGGLLSATRYVLQTIGPLGLLTRGMHA